MDPIFTKCRDAMLMTSRKYLHQNSGENHVIGEFEPVKEAIVDFAIGGLEICCGWNDCEGGELEGWSPEFFADVMCRILCEHFGAGCTVSTMDWCNALSEVLLCFTQDSYAIHNNCMTKSIIVGALAQVLRSSPSTEHLEEHL